MASIHERPKFKASRTGPTSYTPKICTETACYVLDAMYYVLHNLTQKWARYLDEGVCLTWMFGSMRVCRYMYTVLFRSTWPSHITRQVDMAKIRRLSQVTEAVVGVEKPLVKKAKIHFFLSHMGTSQLWEGLTWCWAGISQYRSTILDSPVEGVEQDAWSTTK